jgi:serine/threonine-protein kinase ATR
MLLADHPKLVRLADSLNIQPRRLFSPFWRSIAIAAVKDFQKRPQTTQMLSEVLSMSVPDFLVLTQSYTLPYLILQRHRDVVHRIAQARGDASVWQMCLESTNRGPIIALLIIQPVADIEASTMELFREISSDFDALDLSDVAKSESVPIVYELLKSAGEQDDDKRSRVCFSVCILR